MSINGIRFLFHFAELLDLSSELKVTLKNAFVIAVGPKTAQQLKNYGIPVNLIPTDYTSKGILQNLQQRDINGKSILIPRTSGANPILAYNLKKLGANVHELYVYESVPPSYLDLNNQFLEDLKKNKIDAIIFGSSLSAKNMFKMYKRVMSKENLCKLINDGSTVVAIGPVTAKTLLELGLRVDVIPTKYLFENALQQLSEYWSN
jgi:uroporphyrinogen-III synthase